MACLTRKALDEMGFCTVGENVMISDRASFYNCSQISIGDNTRIDDFCVISAGSGGVVIGANVHVAVYSSLIGSGRIVVSDFANISSRVSIYSSSDDYSGERMTNPTIPSRYTGVQHEEVVIGRHVIIGCGSVVLPGVTLEEGVAVGALSLVRDTCLRYGVYAGVPARRVNERKQSLLELERMYLSERDQKVG